MLEARELCVCEVREVLDLSNSTVKHLSVLRDADLILDRKDGKWSITRLNEQSNNSFVRLTACPGQEFFSDDEQVSQDRKEAAES